MGLNIAHSCACCKESSCESYHISILENTLQRFNETRRCAWKLCNWRALRKHCFGCIDFCTRFTAFHNVPGLWDPCKKLSGLCRWECLGRLEVEVAAMEFDDAVVKFHSCGRGLDIARTTLVSCRASPCLGLNDIFRYAVSACLA